MCLTVFSRQTCGAHVEATPLWQVVERVECSKVHKEASFRKSSANLCWSSHQKDQWVIPMGQRVGPVGVKQPMGMVCFRNIAKSTGQGILID